MNECSDIILQAEGIGMEYIVGKERLQILKGLELSVPRHETVSITGVSGSGKTTLLHILGALERPTAGRVVLGGVDLYRVGEKERGALRSRRIGYVFQSYHLLPELDLLENVVLPAMADPAWIWRAKSARERGRELLDKVGLGDRASHRPSELSGGEQQRAALARALMNDPELIFADEPTGNLDEHSSRRVLDLLMDLAGEMRRTLLMVTHNREIASLCRRQMILEDGGLRGLDH